MGFAPDGADAPDPDPTYNPAMPGDSDRNVCRACGFRWFPAGIDRAVACPRCGSEDITFSWTERWPAYAGCAAIAAFAIAVVFTIARLGLAYW